MDIGNISLYGKYEHLRPKFEKALAYLRDNDLAGMPGGSAVEIEEGVRVRMQHYATAPWEGILFESHRHHFDIHFMVEGEERFGCVMGELPPEGPYDEPADTQMHKDPARAGSLVLRRGDYAIVAPEEPHKPRCALDTPMDVKKIVVKVRI